MQIARLYSTVIYLFGIVIDLSFYTSIRNRQALGYQWLAHIEDSYYCAMTLGVSESR